MENFWLAFIPLFVAFDALGLVPVYWALAQGLPSRKRRQAVHEAVVVATVVALVFLWVSGLVLGVLGIQMGDLLIAGGAILFVLSLHELLHPEKTPDGSADALGAVPFGVPLMAGPAVLTTALLLRHQYGLWLTMLALVANAVVMWVVLQIADRLMQRMGRGGARVVSKVFSLVLAAFAVMLIRKGLATVWPQ